MAHTWFNCARAKYHKLQRPWKCLSRQQKGFTQTFALHMTEYHDYQMTSALKNSLTFHKTSEPYPEAMPLQVGGNLTKELYSIS